MKGNSKISFFCNNNFQIYCIDSFLLELYLLPLRTYNILCTHKIKKLLAISKKYKNNTSINYTYWHNTYRMLLLLCKEEIICQWRLRIWKKLSLLMARCLKTKWVPTGIIFIHPKKGKVTIPFHSKDLTRKTELSILKQAGLK